MDIYFGKHYSLVLACKPGRSSAGFEALVQETEPMLPCSQRVFCMNLFHSSLCVTLPPWLVLYLRTNFTRPIYSRVGSVIIPATENGSLHLGTHQQLGTLLVARLWSGKFTSTLSLSTRGWFSTCKLPLVTFHNQDLKPNGSWWTCMLSLRVNQLPIVN